MSPLRRLEASRTPGLAFSLALGALALLGSLAVLGCDRQTASEQKPAPASAAASTSATKLTSSKEAAPPLPEFESIDPRTLPVRGAPAGTDGRFIARPAIVASPCGLHLVVSGTQASWTALLVGHDLGWSKEGSPLLLELDDITLDVGLIDSKAMGGLGQTAPDALLKLAGQWESTWLQREAGREIPIKDNASGRAHLEPHPAWRVWSTTLGQDQVSADVPTTNAVVAMVALDERVLVLRALLDGEKLAMRALRRLVFAVDSIEHHASALDRRTYVETLRKAAQEDPTCAAIHGAHDAQLE